MKRPLFDVTTLLVSQKTVLLDVQNGKRLTVVTLNPELMLEAHSNSHYRETLNRFSYGLIDGSGLAMIRNLLGYISPERSTGADLVTSLLASGEPCFLLGGLANEAECAREYANAHIPNVHIVGAESGGVISKEHPIPDPSLIQRIQESGARVLLVGFGAPRQELWIESAFPLLQQLLCAVGVGGSFGFYSSKRRAPKFWRVAGIEWLYRGLTEQGHWSRVWRAVVLFPLAAIAWQFQLTRRP